MGKHKNRRIDPDTAEYEEGYCKPPKATQFKPGHQLNKGSKRGRKEPTLSEIGDELVDVPMKNGTVKRMSKREMINRNLVSHAQKASIPHLRIWMENERRVAAGEKEIDPLIFNPELSKGLLDTLKADLKADWEDGVKPKDAVKKAGGKKDG